MLQVLLKVSLNLRWLFRLAQHLWLLSQAIPPVFSHVRGDMAKANKDKPWLAPLNFNSSPLKSWWLEVGRRSVPIGRLTFQGPCLTSGGFPGNGFGPPVLDLKLYPPCKVSAKGAWKSMVGRWRARSIFKGEPLVLGSVIKLKMLINPGFMYCTWKSLQCFGLVIKPIC